MMNLVKYISRSGAASRRNAETLIRAGRVTVSGQVETNPAYRVKSDDRIRLDGNILDVVEDFHYVLLNKPRGYTCSNADPHADMLALHLIHLPGVRLVSAGRLDKDSEGAIIFSDDGDFVNRLSHPRYGILKRYRVITRNPISEEGLEKIRSGIRDGGEMLRVKAVRKIADREYEFILNEGKKREIRRLTAAVGAPTLVLKRLTIGSVELGTLQPGKWRNLTTSEINALKNLMKQS